MTCISEMPQLIDLQIVDLYYNPVNNETLVAHMIQIGMNCSQIRRLSLISTEKANDLFIQSTQTYKKICENFSHLKRLDICGSVTEEFVLIGGFNRITHLTLWIREKFVTYDTNVNKCYFDSLQRNMPKLQFINICMKHITDSVLNSMTNLKNIRKIVVFGKEMFTQMAVNNVITKCPKLVAIFVNPKD